MTCPFYLKTYALHHCRHNRIGAIRPGLSSSEVSQVLSGLLEGFWYTLGNRRCPHHRLSKLPTTTAVPRDPASSTGQTPSFVARALGVAWRTSGACEDSEAFTLAKQSHLRSVLTTYRPTCDSRFRKVEPCSEHASPVARAVFDAFAGSTGVARAAPTLSGLW